METATAIVCITLLVLPAPFLTAQEKPADAKEKPAATESAAPRHNEKPATLKYELANEVKLKGIVEEVKLVPKSCTGETGTHLVLRTDQGLVEVQVAPETFLTDLSVTFTKGEKLTAVAAKVTRPEGDLYLAREVDRDSGTLVLRDPKGGPVWTWKKS